jgi:hypothetical protein
MRATRIARVAVSVASVGCFALIGGLGAVSSEADWPAWLGWLELVRAHRVDTIVIFFVLGTLLAAIATRMKPGTDRDEPVRKARELAESVRKYWEPELKRRGAADKLPIRVRWVPAPPDSVTDWKTITHIPEQMPGWRSSSNRDWAAADPEALSGSGPLISAFRRVPTERLVVLGEAGSGKSALLAGLVVDLLANRTDKDPVPVLVSVASWDPTTQGFDAWFEDQLGSQFNLSAPMVGDPANRSRAACLWQSGLILPILDGLDEIPSKFWPSVIAELNAAMRPGLPFVVSARTGEYRRMVSPVDGFQVHLFGAAGVAVRPLSADEAIAYLTDSARGGDGSRWHPLGIALQEKDSAVAMALSTPLMVDLADRIYNPRRPAETASKPNPSELIDTAKFPDAAAIEAHLFNAFLPAAYGPITSGAKARWTPAQAERWLRFIARSIGDPDRNPEPGDPPHERQRASESAQDIAWWRIREWGPPLLAPVAVGVIAAAAGAAGFSWPLGHGFGIGSGSCMALAVLVGAAALALPGRRPLTDGRTGLAYGLAGGIVGGLLGVVAFATLTAFGWFDTPGAALVGYVGNAIVYAIACSTLRRFWPAVCGGFVGQFMIGYLSYGVTIGQQRGAISVITNGLGVGITAGIAAGFAPRSAPARGNRPSRLGLLGGAAAGLVAGLVIWILVGDRPGLTIGAIGIVTGAIAAGVLLESHDYVTAAASPQATLRQDRATFLTSFLGLGVAVGLTTGLVYAYFPSDISGAANGVAFGVAVGAAVLVVVGIAAGFIRASWGHYVIARVWLAAKGRLPFGLMPFLQDAHARGVLRQNGAAYQFRHKLFHKHLIATPGAIDAVDHDGVALRS